MTQELHDFANRLLHVNVFFPNDKEQNLIKSCACTFNFSGDNTKLYYSILNSDNIKRQV